MWLPLASGFLVLVLSLGVAVLTVNSRNSAGEVQLVQSNAQASEAGPTISLSPEQMTYTFTPNQTYGVGIVVNSMDQMIDGADVIINFDPTKVRIVGTTVTASTMFEQYPSNIVCNAAGDANGACKAGGQIRFSGLTFNPKAVNGFMGTFTYRPLQVGEVNFTVEHTQGATTDSNIALDCPADGNCTPGLDGLTSVVNASYSFE